MGQFYKTFYNSNLLPFHNNYQGIMNSVLRLPKRRILQSATLRVVALRPYSQILDQRGD